MKIGMIQFRPVEGNLEKTIQKIMELMRDASKQDIAILCFPEMALSGYTLTPDEALLNEQNRGIERIRFQTDKSGMTVLLGGIEKNGEDYFIAQYVIDKEIRSYRKMHLGEKEKNVYCAGMKPGLFEVDGLHYGILLCYDSRFPELAQMLALLGADIIFVPTASPNQPERRIAMWKRYLVARAYDNRVNVAATNLLFDERGGGMIGYDKSGEVLFEHQGQEDRMLVFEPDNRSFDNSSMTKRDFLAEKRELLAHKSDWVGIDKLWFGDLTKVKENG